MTGCHCAKPGFCPILQREMVDRDWEWCSGNCPPERPCDEQTRVIYRNLWSKSRPEILAKLATSPYQVIFLAFITPFPVQHECGGCGSQVPDPLEDQQVTAEELAVVPSPAADSFTLTELAIRAGQAYAKWAAAGFPRPTPEQYQERESICSSCEYLDPQTKNRCLHPSCGCYLRRRALTVQVGKLSLGTEKCPINRWLATYEPKEECPS